MGCCKKLTYIIPILCVGIYFLKEYWQGCECPSAARIDGKTVIVTGANTGLGKTLAEELVKRGGRVILACRSVEKCENAARDIKNHTNVANDRVQPMKLDLGSFESIRKFAEDFKKDNDRLDILINNAAVAWVPFQKTEHGFESHFGINHLGHFFLTHLMLDMLKKSSPSRIVTVADLAYEFINDLDFNDLNHEQDYSATQAYLWSKLANVLSSRQLSKYLKGTGVTTYAVHPGAIATFLQKPGFVPFPLDYIIAVSLWPITKDPWHGIQTQLCCAVSEEFAAETGKYYSECAEKATTSAGSDDKAAKRLWDISMELTKLS